MNLRKTFRSYLASALFSPASYARRQRWSDRMRRFSGARRQVYVFLELDDPYSYLLAQYLPELKACYDIELHVCLMQALGEGFRPRADMLAVHAERDCARIAVELGIPFLDKGAAPPVEHRRALIDALAAGEGSADHAGDVLEAISLYWRGDAEGAGRRVSNAQLSGQGDDLLKRNQARLAKLGHYNGATLLYGGEWYWGVDRLHYLTKRLDSLGLRCKDAAMSLPSMRQISQLSLPVSPPGAARELPPLEFFVSFRSPYSYLSLQRVYDIADAFGLQLQIRPVLPMVMRGLPMPRNKARYIMTDVAREAGRHEIPFGRFADPLGAGVERCLAVCRYAASERKGRDFLLNAARAIWAERVDVATDKGLRKVTGRTGLFWPDVKAAIESDDWRDGVERNRESMMESGVWGVPTLRLGEFTIWGQDRLWLLVRHIEEQCDTGDGILV